MTPEEFDALPEGRWVPGYRYELINGVLIVTPPPGAGERGPNDELGHLLRLHKATHPEGSRLDETLPEQTLATTPQRRRCDRALWIGLGRAPDPERDVPAVVVEFVSHSRRDALRDYEIKREEYRRLGVREYWVVDRFRRLLTVYRMGPGAVVTVVIRESETYQTDLLPGFLLPLARLLAVADRLPKTGRHRPPARGAQ